MAAQRSSSGERQAAYVNRLMTGATAAIRIAPAIGNVQRLIIRAVPLAIAKATGFDQMAGGVCQDFRPGRGRFRSQDVSASVNRRLAREGGGGVHWVPGRQCLCRVRTSTGTKWPCRASYFAIGADRPATTGPSRSGGYGTRNAIQAARCAQGAPKTDNRAPRPQPRKEACP